MNPTIPEADLLREALDQLARYPPTAAGLHDAVREHGLDFATAWLYQSLRTSPRHGPFIAQVESAATLPPTIATDIAIVPGAFYKERPETGADGRIVIESARRLGYATVTVPLHSFGTVADNAELLANWLKERDGRPLMLVSHSKSATEIRQLLARPDAPELFRPVRAWVDLSGLFLGTPLIDWLRRHRVNYWLVRLFFWLKGFKFAALEEIARESCPPWPGALERVPHLRVVHVVGFPLERHLTTPLARRGYRRLSPLGPNDGTILLEDVFALPGWVYPLWGADHYLRPAGRDSGEIIAGILGWLQSDRHFA